MSTSSTSMVCRYSHEQNQARFTRLLVYKTFSIGDKSSEKETQLDKKEVFSFQEHLTYSADIRKNLTMFNKGAQQRDLLYPWFICLKTKGRLLSKSSLPTLLLSVVFASAKDGSVLHVRVY